MPRNILLTSFQTWLPHQQSNASDDLLAQFETKELDFAKLFFLRQLPVEVLSAREKVISKIEEVEDLAIICCGMAESRHKLTIESNATCGDHQIQTSVNLEKLITGLSGTEISHDAGKFVCEGLYYQVLNYLKAFHPQIPCIFVHVPVLTSVNLDIISADFQLIIEKMANL